jgi:hypothetical protein
MPQRIAIVVSFVAALLLATSVQADTAPAPDTRCDCPHKKGVKCDCPKCKAGKGCPHHKKQGK